MASMGSTASSPRPLKVWSRPCSLPYCADWGDAFSTGFDHRTRWKSLRRRCVSIITGPPMATKSSPNPRRDDHSSFVIA